MKKCKRIGAALLILVMTVALSISAAAAVKNGLVKKRVTDDLGTKDYIYYYYKSGKMVKNAWKTVKQGGKKYKFYFGKNGKACKAKVNFSGNYVVKVYTIKGKKYGFDTKAHRVTRGNYVDEKGRLWVFKSNGRLNQAETTRLRTAIPVGTVGTDLNERVIATFGEPNQIQYDTSCDKWNAVSENDQFTDIILTYDYMQVQIVRNEQTGEYKMNGFTAYRVR